MQVKIGILLRVGFRVVLGVLFLLQRVEIMQVLGRALYLLILVFFSFASLV